MISLVFSRSEKEKNEFISTLKKKGWEVNNILNLEYGVKYTVKKGKDEARFVLYKNKSNSYTKLVIEKGTSTFETLLSNLLNSNKLLEQGKGDSKSNNSQVSSHSSRPTKEIPHFKIHIGTDETGKGDYFGPLVVAGVMLDEETEKKLTHLGISDSKKHNNNANKKLMNELFAILPENHYSIKIITPIEYNKMFSDIGNTNNILSIAHTSVIRDLLAKNPECKDVIVDQFANENLLRFYLSNEIKKQKINLFQTPKGERDLAVAAASIIARGTLINVFEKMSNDIGKEIPFGAGDAVDKTAKELLKKILVEQMGKYVKLNFANTKKILE